MLADWFKLMNQEKWQNKWTINEYVNVDEALLNHYNWVKESNITHTPTFFVNGKLLPNRYNLEKLKKILPQLAS